MSSPEDHPHEITRLLAEASSGDAKAADGLIPLVYEQLRIIARNRMLNERPGHTLQATELVHEAFIKLAPDLIRQDWRDRTHFYHAAAEAMRRILVDHARGKATGKRGAGAEHVSINLIDVAGDDPEKILALDDAFSRLSEMDEQLGHLVRLRLFAGLSVEETAKTLGISPRSVVRGWAFARSWLGKELGGV